MQQITTQSHQSTNGTSRVQWVIPPTKRTKKDVNSNKKATNSNPASVHRTQLYQQNNDKSNNPTRFGSNDSGVIDRDESDNVSLGSGQAENSSNRNNNRTLRPVIDQAVCKVICTFVEEHLKELLERQRSINNARASKLVTNNNQQQGFRTASDNHFIALNDISKLKVRDEQTKAIETIKQLTNYLRELTFLKNQCDSESVTVDDNVFNRLSELRTDIIQALNDFVLSNSDIDVPIIDLEECGYDLCMDAADVPAIDQRPSFNSISTSQSSSSEDERIKRRNCVQPARIVEQPIIVIGDNGREEEIDLSSSHQQTCLVMTPELNGIEKRKREILKLERDTVELRRLFSDFYTLISTQSEQVSSIEDNIVITTQRIREGQHNLNRTMKGLTILMPVTGCMAGALIGGPIGIAIGGKLGGITIGCASTLLGLISSYSAQRCILANKIKDD